MSRLLTSVALAAFLGFGGVSLAPTVGFADCGKEHKAEKHKHKHDHTDCEKSKKAGKKDCNCAKQDKAACEKCKKSGKKDCACDCDCKKKK
ncbi:MAG: hypothetical protein QNJ97_26775 [Myxococcota bacterium]|nr:hypothetical protein [Myxococcota bacterium]